MYYTGPQSHDVDSDWSPGGGERGEMGEAGGELGGGGRPRHAFSLT